MTTTTLYQGLEGKNSSRVLRPPGGVSSNIFGGEDPAPRASQQQQQQEAQQQQREAVVNTNQNQASGAAAAQATQAQAPKNREEAPYAGFAESGKMSDPSQFDHCSSSESQNEADFRCYSVTAYRDAMATNAAVKQRARGQASGAFNPITHEENGPDPSPFQGYEQRRVHPQQQTQANEQQRPVRGQARAPQYNPITGEEYPASYGQQKEEDEDKKEEDEEEEKQQDGQTTEGTADSSSAPAEIKTEQPQQQGPPPVKKPSTRVRQPPGGASSGLW